MLLARGAGGSARALGRQAATARDIDPAHRRDGLGLAALGLALVLAIGVWWHGAGPAGAAITTAARYLVGSASGVLPLLVALFALHVLRHAPDPNSRGRHIVGWAALSAGALGLLHLSHGAPGTPAGRLRAGGLLGTLAGDPLRSAVTTWVAAPLLVLLVVFGLLVVTATPLNQVWSRTLGLRDRVLRRRAAGGTDEEAEDADPADAADGDEPTRRRRPSRRRQG
ncbi:MAG: DNA translocase FtsK 4TM domain-containing protein, partial [Actinomycetota bacterium]|nr:DNA translocase FtsK 4TM domain-containing protein [Actinomycetota bacterium]